MPFPLVQPVAVSHGVIPGNIVDRTGRLGRKVLAIEEILPKLEEFGHRHLMNHDCEGIVDANIPLHLDAPFGAALPADLGRGRADDELSRRRDDDQSLSLPVHEPAAVSHG